VRHRRPISAGLAFLSVLLGLTAVIGSSGSSAPVSGQTADASSLTNAGQVEVPIRLADPAVAAVVRPGDVVDVIASDRGASARVVAARVTVTRLPETGGDGLWGTRDGLVMVASDEDEALALAGAAARGPVTIVIHP
jgi:hypothetical protein